MVILNYYRNLSVNNINGIMNTPEIRTPIIIININISLNYTKSYHTNTDDISVVRHKV